VDMAWKNGKLISATIHSFGGNACQVRCGDLTRELKIKKGASLQLDGNLQ
jgi:hypothetical protein